MKLKLDKVSRLVVPKPLRDRFALKTGDELEVSLELDGFRLRPVQAQPALTQEKGILVCASEVPASVWDLGEFLDHQRQQRASELGGF
jgi:AbrB family looped-hinge helix DNA binding protein